MYEPPISQAKPLGSNKYSIYSVVSIATLIAAIGSAFLILFHFFYTRYHVSPAIKALSFGLSLNIPWILSGAYLGLHLGWRRVWVVPVIVIGALYVTSYIFSQLDRPSDFYWAISRATNILISLNYSSNDLFRGFVGVTGSFVIVRCFHARKHPNHSLKADGADAPRP